MSNSTLENVFNLPEMIEDIEDTASNISHAFEDMDGETKELGNVNHLLDDFKDSLSQDDMSAIVDIAKYDTEMDEIADKTLTEFDDLIALGKDAETRFAGEIFSAAAQMAKIALDAKNNKVKAKLHILELSIRRKRNELLEQKQNYEMSHGQQAQPAEGSAKQLSREDLVEIARQMAGDKTKRT